MADQAGVAAQRLEQMDPQRVFTMKAEPSPPGVVFMFPGQGSQFVNMGRELYASESVFRTQVDRICEILLPLMGYDLRTILYPKPGEEEAATLQLTQTVNAQPALFTVEYALAQLWKQPFAHLDGHGTVLAFDWRYGTPHL